MATVNPPPSSENTALHTPHHHHLHHPRTASSSSSISDILSELSRLINDRENEKYNSNGNSTNSNSNSTNNNDDPDPDPDADVGAGDDDDDRTPQYDPAIIEQLETITADMQTMNNRLSRTVWQMDNRFDGVQIRMTRLNNRLGAIESGLKTLISVRESPEARAAEKAAEEHNRRARLLNKRARSQDKLVPLHNRQNLPIANFTADTPYKLANEHNQDRIVEWLKAFGLSTEEIGCHMRLTDFMGVPYDKILDNLEIRPKSYFRA